jgi:4'-phosphopantetheinyl transferase
MFDKLLDPGCAVVVWKINLNHLSPDISLYSGVLNECEIEKSRRFYFQKDRQRYIQSHAILRMILGKELGVLPGAVQFTTNPYGKPYIISDGQQPGLFFNISHSQTGLLIALSRGIECGVDIEYQRDDFPSNEIAERFFSKKEFEVFKALPETQKKEAFFNCWTRKEAFIKAKGMGLSIPLDSFDVSLVPGDKARLVASSLEEGDISNWSLENVDTWFQYSAALCAKCSNLSVVYREWPERNM